jgi:hypothetical protein
MNILGAVEVVHLAAHDRCIVRVLLLRDGEIDAVTFDRRELGFRLLVVVMDVLRGDDPASNREPPRRYSYEPATS